MVSVTIKFVIVINRLTNKRKKMKQNPELETLQIIAKLVYINKFFIQKRF